MTDPLRLRVMVQDAWDEVPLDLPPDTSLAELKRRALDATRVLRDPDEYVLKFRGAELYDESRSLTEAGLVPNGAVIVLPRRRRPVR
ncbi:MAG TPA: ubiquitin-like domain-containing protein [Gemmatimonadales bacterium]